MRTSTPTTSRPLIPLWFRIVTVGGLTLFTLLLAAVTAALGEGLAGLSMWGLVATTALVLVAAVSSLVRPRRRREPEIAADGTRVFRAPALTTWALVAAWVVLLGTAALWGWLAFTDLDALESPGFALVTAIGALASLPDFVRLLTGRLHRWTLTLAPDALTYRGYRTDVSLPWSDVRGAEIQQRGPAGVRIISRGRDLPEPVMPIAAFSVPAEQLVDEVMQARKARRG